MTSANCKKRKTCRLCESHNLRTAINLNSTPLANSFLSKNKLKKKEYYYPLKVNFCLSCHHLQLSHSVSAKSMFTNYLYLTNTSKIGIKDKLKRKKGITILSAKLLF